MASRSVNCFARLGQRLVPLRRARHLRGSAGPAPEIRAPRRGRRAAQAGRERRASDARRPPGRRPAAVPALALTERASTSLTQIARPGARFSRRPAPAGRHLAILRDFALRLRRGREERLEALRLVGPEAPSA